MLRQQSIDGSVVGDKSDQSLFLFLGLTLMAVVILGSSVAYLPTSTTSIISFEKIGQRLFWLSILLAVVIGLLFGSRVAKAVILAAAVMLLSRVSSAISPGISLFANTYQLSYSVIIMLAAASLYVKAGRPYEQAVKLVIFLSVPILLLQLLGVSEALYFVGTQGFEVMPVFRVGIQELALNQLQLRPTGLFFANSISAIFVVFAIAYRLSHPISRVTIYDIFLFYMTFLMMAKIAIVFLVVALSARFVVAEGKGEKLMVVRLALVAGVLLLVHWAIFPGVVEDRLSLNLFYTSGAVRILDFVLSAGITDIPFLGINVSGLGELRIADDAVGRYELARQLEISYGPDQAIGTSTGIGFLALISPFLVWVWLQIRRIKERLFLSAHDRRRSIFLLLALFHGVCRGKV